VLRVTNARPSRSRGRRALEAFHKPELLANVRQNEVERVLGVDRSQGGPAPALVATRARRGGCFNTESRMSAGFAVRQVAPEANTAVALP